MYTILSNEKISWPKYQTSPRYAALRGRLKFRLTHYPLTSNSVVLLERSSVLNQPVHRRFFFFFSFTAVEGAKTRSEREKEKIKRLFSSSPTTIPLRRRSINAPRFIFHHARSTDFEEKMDRSVNKLVLNLQFNENLWILPLNFSWLQRFSKVAALKHRTGNGITESNINDRKQLKNFTLHNLVQSKENLFQLVFAVPLNIFLLICLLKVCHSFIYCTTRPIKVILQFNHTT